MKPKYWDKAIKELSSKDPILKKIIGNHKNEYLIPSNDPFNTLVNSIIGQQISTHAAKSIKMKLEKLTKINPKATIALNKFAIIINFFRLYLSASIPVNG